MNDIFGFLVGIERYDQPGWSQAGPCANAIAMAQWLLSIQASASNIYLFVDPHHDCEQAISELEVRGVQVKRCADFNTIDTFWRTTLSSERPAGSRLLVYWSGHGFTESDGTRVFICRDYTATSLKNRVFNGTNFRRHLRSADFQCYCEQLFLADVCAVWAGLDFEALKFPPKQLVNVSRQVAYFATPEGQYARGKDDIGVFTRITLDVLRRLNAWPDLKAFSERMNDAFKQASQTPFRVDESDEAHETPNRLVGYIAEDAGSALFQSVWSLLSPIDIPDSVYRPHFLRTVSSLGIPELAQAQGLSGMIRVLTALCDTAGTAQAPYGLLEFLVRLNSVEELANAINAWLVAHAADQRNALANARERVRLEGDEKILVVDVHNDAQGEISFYEASLRTRDLLPVPDIRLPSSPVMGWDAFRALFPTVIETLCSTHAISDFQIHFMVEPPLFDKPFHSLPVADSTLGERFVVLVRYRERLRGSPSVIRRCWCEYAEALRGKPPRQIDVLPIPGPGSGAAGPAPEAKGLCYARFTVPPASQGIKEKQTLLRLLRSGAAYLSWSHEPPPADDWGQIETCLTACLGAIQTLDRFPEAFTSKRISGHAVAHQTTLLWDDPEFNPFLKPRGIRIL